MKNSTNSMNTKEYKENFQLANECVAEGVKLLRAGKLKLAEDIVRRGITLFEEINDVNKTASSLNVLSIIYDEMGNDLMCMESMLDAIDISLSSEAYDMAAKVYNNIGSKFMYLKSYERALKFFKLSLEMFNKAIEKDLVSDIDTQAFALILNLNISATYSHMGELDIARQYYKVAKEKSTHPYSERVLHSFQCYEGILLWRIGDKEEAMSLVDSIMSTVEKCEFSTDYLDSAMDLLELIKAMKDYDRWKNILGIIENRLKNDISIYDKITILELWLDYYSATGETQEYTKTCSEYYKLYQEKEFHEYEKRADMLHSILELRESKKEKEETEKIVYLDPLTGIGNRNKLLADSENLMRESAQNKSALTIGLIDIDFFKECNDTYGHIEGDACLKKVAGVLNDSLNGNGNVYRYGGDEFLILSSKYTEDEVVELGKTIKQKLEELQIPNIKSQIAPYITVSQGYTQVYATENASIENFINSADGVLYAVKRGGRNNYKYTKYLEIVSSRYK